MNQSKTFTYLLATGSVSLVALMVCYPEVAVGGSIKGLTIWWNQVFPALFPFFVLAELMISFGVVNFAGILMEPLMRPIFRLPGIGGFVLMMGVVSGFPAGARITADLYKDKKLTKSEAERLASFTNFSNPLFIFSVTAVQFFHQASLGIIFALSHYLGNLCVGLTMRFFSKSKKKTSTIQVRSRFVYALERMHQERLARNQPFGKKIGDAVVSSVSTLLAIGGFIALFSMLYQLFLNIGAINLLGEVLSICFKWIGFSPELGSAVIPGLFELTIGDKSVAELTSVPLIEQVVVVSGLLGFCGFSIQAQAVSILSQAGLRSRLFLIGRILQMIYSSIAAFFLFHVFPTSSGIETTTAFSQNVSALTHHAVVWGPTLTFVMLIIFIVLQLHRVCSHSHHLNG
ncbi:sporulation integral membrane protein YlbJ [Sporolactobacillus terrae]|uniref:Sporulation integral membrane protein YlbJ n=1 Tax=Sporolactobacillus terrae TaxID=269673 RepID=A0A410D856_9BACL|nr:sporulation integral membrane protein YlbJ [Sporolactobacillus terrae]QAA22249.1 sporulation integral membrane protein YlbJ [Sporolactobacillus terrae]QAA25223.1 sporulation integral membrane protein YlbJ [Sporolactobacillus terrae]UAK17038.1 sporulation integral membrane protein YlbJ [Sporolactobacillus terrae]BBN98560.1 sporulation integral membrane protein YlbJ [Sporolactobacillus terrae]